METKWTWAVGIVIGLAVAATFWVESKKDSVDKVPGAVASPQPSEAALPSAIPPAMLPEQKNPSSSPPPVALPTEAPRNEGNGQAPGTAYSPPPYQPIQPDYDAIPPPPPQSYGDSDSFDPDNPQPAVPMPDYEGGSGGTGGENGFAPPMPPGYPPAAPQIEE